MANNNVEDLAGLKVNTDSVSASLISIIKKYRDDSISEIKRCILNKDYVLSCDFSGGSERFAELIRLHDDLIAAGYSVSLFDEGEESNIDYFRNWLKSILDTSDRIDKGDSFFDDVN